MSVDVSFGGTWSGSTAWRSLGVDLPAPEKIADPSRFSPKRRCSALSPPGLAVRLTMRAEIIPARERTEEIMRWTLQMETVALTMPTRF